MLYARTAVIDGKEVLVDDAQNVAYKEHMILRHRILFLNGVITGETSLHDFFMALDSLSHEPIKLFITSPGGDIDSTLLFYDALKLIKSPVVTIGRYCGSAAALILAAGSRRYLFPHAKVMLHLPMGQMGGDSRDWDIQHLQMEKYKNKIVDVLCECGARKSREEILADIDRDFWLEPQEAIDYGLADEIITSEVWQAWIKGDK